MDPNTALPPQPSINGADTTTSTPSAPAAATPPAQVQSPVVAAAPQVPAPAAGSVPGTPYKQSHVVVLKGVTTFDNRFEAVMEWGADGRIRLMSSQQVFFDVQPQEIKKFTITMGQANIKLVNGQKFHVEFSGAARNLAATAALANNFGLLGTAADVMMSKKAKDAEETSDIYWWKTNLARYGVGGATMGASLMYKISVGFAIAIAIFIVLALIASYM